MFRLLQGLGQAHLKAEDVKSVMPMAHVGGVVALDVARAHEYPFASVQELVEGGGERALSFSQTCLRLGHWA